MRGVGGRTGPPGPMPRLSRIRDDQERAGGPGLLFFIMSQRRSRKRTRRPPPGSPPGTISTTAAEPPANMMLTAYGPDTIDERRVESVADFAAVLTAHRHPVVWLDVDGVGDAATLQSLGAVLGLHRLTLADIANTTQRPKVEDYGAYIFVVMRAPVKCADTNRVVECEQVSMVLGKGFAVSFQERHKPGDCFGGVRDRIRQAHGNIRSSGADYLMYALLDASIDGYFPLIEEIGEHLDGIEEQMMARLNPANVRRMHELRRELLTIRRAAWPLRDAVSSLHRDLSPLIADSTRIYLRDCYDHVVQIIDLVETSRELAAGLFDMQLSLASNRMNQVMKVLTIITTIFIPLSFVAGIYGMNFDTSHPANMPETRFAYGYPLILSIMLAIALAMMWAFWHVGWLSRENKDA
jgi:magnesium transporter